MPRVPRRALIWSSDHGRYELHAYGQLEQPLLTTDDDALLAWLGQVTGFAFRGRSGSLNVYQERRPHGGSYWYAYHSDRDGIRKRYLGPTAKVTLARLEATAQSLASASPLATPPGSPNRPVAAASLVLATKLTPPRLPRSLVERGRLLAMLDSALSTSLTLVSASAGWGKTTLLAAWAQRHQGPVAWLSLDELDNSPTRFWVALISALRRGGSYGPGLGETALALLQSPQPPALSTIVMALLHEVENRAAHLDSLAPTTPIVLIVDDYQVITDPTIHESLRFFLEHLPTHLRLVVASRVDPDLPLARLRARGQLTELRMDALRFGPEEASAFFRLSMGLALLDDEAAALGGRTEGWVAGLQLAALALPTQGTQEDRAAWIARFTGSQRYILDYVQQEILQRQPLPLQRFLLQVAVLARMNAALCQAVTGEPASQVMLETLERSNLFMVPLDEERQWYRMHDLFREALLARLAAHEPALLSQLHLRAARWYETAGELREAIAHALAAPDFAYAARLMEQAAPHCWFSGESQTVQTWLGALPDPILWEHASLALQATLRLLESLFATTEATYARAQALVQPTLARLSSLLRQHQAVAGQSEGPPMPEKDLPVIERRLRLLRALLETRALMLRGDQARLAQQARDAEGLAQEEELSWQMPPLFIEFQLTETFQREGARLLARLLEARERAERAGDLLASIRVRSWVATAYVRARQWPRVEQECLAGLALLAQSSVRFPSAGYLQYHLATADYAWNRLDEAACALQEVLRIGQEWRQVDLLISGQLDVARLAIARGELSAADQALAQAGALFRREPVVPLASAVMAYRVKYWLAAGELGAAQHWAEHAVFSPDPARWDPNDQWAVRMLVRVQVALGQPLRALEVLECFRAPLTPPGDPYSAIEWLALYVVALHRAGEQEQALEATARLLAQTEPQGDLRLYLDLGDPMRRALLAWLTHHGQDEPDAASTKAYVAKLLATFAQEQQGASQARETAAPHTPVPSLAPPATVRSPLLGTTLTRREQEVLRLLAEGASNQEIADTLIVELSTVKKHVSNVLAKLGAKSRTQAVAQARARALL